MSHPVRGLLLTIEICVQSTTTEGFTVQVFYGDTGNIFTDGFEGGGTGGWSATS